MTPKKVSLEGRKRISELGAADTVETKKAELKAMQSVHQAALFEELTPPASPPPAPPSSQQRTEITIQLAIDKLLSLYEKLSQPKDRNNYYTSPQQRAAQLLTMLRELLQQKAGAGMVKRLSDAENLRQCQAFVDEVCAQLAKYGIRMNKLHVVPAEKRR